MNSVIDLNDVCFSYGGEEVLHNVSFRIGARSLVAVVGPNGGGKTTLLKLLLGALAPRFGSVRVLGDAPGAARGRVGYVPQSLPFDAKFPVTVGEVVLMGRVGRGRFGFYGRADRDAAADALGQVRLEGFWGRAFAELSGGERQRVMIAQALAGGAELLLLDEPVANIDPAHTARMYALFGDLTARMTVMMVSHNLSVVTSHATHVLCVNRTAALHDAADVAGGRFVSADGGDLLSIRHGADCQVADASAALCAPHNGKIRN
ncbi:MAG: ATP-binding cassette domain-containing protein [Kiritimatiellaeota bacterium]|nr:ATP-binding cassette domain-containing protein [Kiritimatiellota bacterium]